MFIYKFDIDGFLVKLKAQIYVRGDLETITNKEKRVAMLATRTARILFTLITVYNLDL